MVNGRGEAQLNEPVDRWEPRTKSQREFLENNADGEGFMPPSSYCRWVRVYDQSKAIATFYICEWADDGKPTGDVRSIGLAEVRKGQPPRPWRVNHVVHINDSLIDRGLMDNDLWDKRRIREWFDSWEIRTIESMSLDQQKALRRLRYLWAVGDEFPEQFEVWETEEYYREQYFPIYSKIGLKSLAKAFEELEQLNTDYWTAGISSYRAPSRHKGVRGTMKVRPIAMPGGETRWQFPGFKINARDLAQILFKWRGAGNRTIQLEQLLKARDLYKG